MEVVENVRLPLVPVVPVKAPVVVATAPAEIPLAKARQKIALPTRKATIAEPALSVFPLTTTTPLESAAEKDQ